MASTLDFITNIHFGPQWCTGHRIEFAIWRYFHGVPPGFSLITPSHPGWLVHDDALQAARGFRWSIDWSGKSVEPWSKPPGLVHKLPITEFIFTHISPARNRHFEVHHALVSNQRLRPFSEAFIDNTVINFWLSKPCIDQRFSKPPLSSLPPPYIC
jgi:hypothetical protein